MRLLASLPIVHPFAALAVLLYALVAALVLVRAATSWPPRTVRGAVRRASSATWRARVAWFPVLILVVGGLLVALGAALIYAPAGLIVAGVGLVALAWEIMSPPLAPPNAAAPPVESRQ